ncbi:aldose 1-epimerase [Halomonas sp. LBP4]|uniref:aldose 1-epimerase n=1 Tax=Halomonas sp. LBP4 TaxID=2044917 RepID=UPI000D75C237|nr:aldose 1-epimerase [Halomonas sp. LBP4]PXX96253.1 aldose epimerase [Halomonas sp. LBP4]
MMVALDNGKLRLLVNPAIGGAVVRFDALTEDGPVALMRPGTVDEQDPNRLAMYPLVPWSNRISAGGFEWRGRHYPLAPNLAGEPLPIHGDGWQRPWRVEGQERHELRLVLRSREQPPFDYRAELVYRLEGESLAVELSATHLGEAPAPYGLGLHPWFPRSADARLEALAEGVWEVDAAQLPTQWRRLETGEAWNFSAPSALPEGKIDNLFTGWGGRALLHWPERGVALEMSAGPAVSRYLVYSPGAEADFFCVEPVSHAVDAHHLGASEHGLVELAPGQSLRRRYRFRASSIVT